jgi:predicted kinase/uncharacterized glyoxalase superfamily protein PhnB
MRHEAMATLYIFGGLPGTGKTTLARRLAQERGAVYLRIDTIEQALRDAGVAVRPEGYLVAYAVAAEHLGLGHDVVADSVNPLAITRTAWRDVATRSGARSVEIEVICSNPEEHRKRVETRSTDVPGLRVPTWSDVVSREYEPWDRPRIVVDTSAGSMDESLGTLERALGPSVAARGETPAPASAALRLELFTHDLAASLDFYVRILGFTQETERPGGYTPLSRGSARVALNLDAELERDHPLRMTSSERAGLGVEIVLEVADVEALHEHVVSEGWPVSGPLQRRPWGLTDFRVSDPDGYCWRITSRS